MVVNQILLRHNMAFEAEIERIRQLKADFIATQGQDMLAAAFDLSALIKLRIQTTGQNYQGGQLPYYTPFTVRTRKAKGYQVGFVDYTQTGQLWASVGPRLISADNGIAKVVIESRNERGKGILDKAEPKRGNLLQPSADELKTVEESYKLRRLNRLNI